MTCKLTFDAGGKTTSEVQSGKQSMSRSQLAQVTGEADLVEQFDLTVPIFDGFAPAIQGTITCALDADATKQSFAITPLRAGVTRITHAGRSPWPPRTRHRGEGGNDGDVDAEAATAVGFRWRILYGFHGPAA
jgi:hypothetical protein